MATKPKSRKTRPVGEAAEVAPPVNGAKPEAAAEPREETRPAEPPAAEDAVPLPTVPTTVKLRKRKSIPPQVEKPTARETLRTVEDRMKDLAEVPSLKHPPAAASGPDLPEVDTSAGPPPVPAPPPEAEPTPSGMVDRGLPIPEHYGMDRLVMLMRDPHWLFAYWELKGGVLERLRFQHSAEIIDNSRWVLRVKTVQTGARAGGGERGTTQYMVDVDIRVGQWYLKVSPNTTFCVDMGFINQQGDFTLVVQGNEIHTPRAGVSDVVDERWMILRDDLEKLLAAGGAASPATLPQTGSVQGLARIVRSEQPRAIGLFSSHSYPKPDEALPDSQI